MHNTISKLSFWGLLLIFATGALGFSPATVAAEDTETAAVEATATAGFLARIEALQRHLNELRLSFAAFVGAEHNAELPKGIKKRLERGKPLPPGWEKKLTGEHTKEKKDKKENGTTTPSSDTKAPRISERPVVVGTSTASVSWNTNEPSWGRIRFAMLSPLAGVNAEAISAAFSTRHQVALSGLTPEATYGYLIVAADKVGNTVESDGFTFRTSAFPVSLLPATSTSDTVAPRIFEGPVVVGTSTASIRWHTNEPTTAELRYGTETPRAASSTAMSSGVTLATSHQVAVEGLTPNTLYNYHVFAVDGSGNRAESDVFTFRTAALPALPPADTEPPHIIIAFPRSVGSTTAKLVWVTSELSDSRLFVGTTTTVDTNAAPTVSASGLVYYRELEVTGLATSTEHFYAVASTDAAGNRAILSGNSFRTTAE